MTSADCPAQRARSRRDRPRAKGVGVPLASRRGCSRAAATKKRADLGSSCHVGHGSATLVVAAIEIKKLRKPGLMSATEKPAQTRQEFLFGFFWSSRPEHNQNSPTDTAKRRFALIPTRRKIAVSPLGAQSTPPLARCRSRRDTRTRISRSCSSSRTASGRPSAWRSSPATSRLLLCRFTTTRRPLCVCVYARLYLPAMIAWLRLVGRGIIVSRRASFV